MAILGLLDVDRGGSFDRWDEPQSQVEKWRPPGEKGCNNVNLRGAWFDQIVWSDIERALRHPGDVIDDLVAENSLSSAAAIAEAERTTLGVALENLGVRRQRALGLHSRGAITDREFDALAEEIAAERSAVESHLRGLADVEPERQVTDDVVKVLQEIARRLDNGLDDATKREVAALLVKRISLHAPQGDTPARVVIEYRFPRVAITSTDTGSSPSPA